jgi:hypothetical protein
MESAENNANVNADANQRALISWRDVSAAVDELITKTERTLDVFDHSLALQDWGSKARCEALKVAMMARRVRIRMLIVDTQIVTTELPRLMQLLKTLGHQMSIMAAPEGAFPASNFVVADQQHLLFRPNSVRSTGSLHFHNPYKSIGYAQSFEVIWQQGGRRVFPEAFGL